MKHSSQIPKDIVGIYSFVSFEVTWSPAVIFGGTVFVRSLVVFFIPSLQFALFYSRL